MPPTTTAAVTDGMPAGAGPLRRDLVQGAGSLPG